jgi:hypothetical protein
MQRLLSIRSTTLPELKKNVDPTACTTVHTIQSWALRRDSFTCYIFLVPKKKRKKDNNENEMLQSATLPTHHNATSAKSENTPARLCQPMERAGGSAKLKKRMRIVMFGTCGIQTGVGGRFGRSVVVSITEE